MNRDEKLLDTRPEELAYELIEDAEKKKRETNDPIEKAYWQGKADMGRILNSILLPKTGIAWGIRSAANEDLLSEREHDLLDVLIAKGR